MYGNHAMVTTLLEILLPTPIIFQQHPADGNNALHYASMVHNLGCLHFVALILIFKSYIGVRNLAVRGSACYALFSESWLQPAICMTS
jgi:hypothetical protein